MASDYGDIQVMMTLSALAATATTPLPGGVETVGEQQLRMLDNMNAELADQGLATGGAWEAIWVGLSNDRANMSYVAQNTEANQYALSIRGTVPADVANWAEDLDVGVVVPFSVAGGAPVMISQGALQAFEAVTTAVFDPPTAPALAGTNLLDALTTLLAQGPSGATVYITGHSLGGATATTVALYLAGQTWSTNPPTFQVITFAAPTAGLVDFAGAFSQAFPTSVRVYNAFDVVPNAWQSLADLDGYFPSPGGPAASTTYVPEMVGGFLSGIAGLAYTQPSPNPYPINLATDGTYLYDPLHVGGHSGLEGKLEDTEDYLAQIGYQHSSATYLMLLGAPAPSLAAPRVSVVSPQEVSEAGAPVTITGSGFTGATTVCFGALTVDDFTVTSDNQISVAAPAGAGTVHVTVVNAMGTSTTSAGDEVTFPPLVTAVAPPAGPLGGGVEVTISGSGLTGATGVQFGSVAGSGITVLADNQITAVVPAAASAASVPVTVTTPVGTSPVGTSSAPSPVFTYLPAPTSVPSVDSVSPAQGPTTGGTPVTISGSGFTGASAVAFGSSAAPGFAVVSDDTIIATAPPQVAGAVDVTVTNAAGPSATSSADTFTFTTPASPTATDLYPASGPHRGGTTVAITGSGFTGATGVAFGSKEASFVVTSDSQITAVSPGAGVGIHGTAVQVTISAPGGSVVAPGDFTYDASSS